MLCEIFSRQIARLCFSAAVAVFSVGLASCDRPRTGLNDVEPKRLNETTVSFFMQGPADFISLSHSGAAPIKLTPSDIRPLLSSRDGNSLALTAILRDRNGEVVGLASELEDFPISDDFDGASVWDTYWTVVINGRGALLLHEKESLGPEVGRVFAETLQGTQDWTGNLVHASNVGPSPDGFGVIVGGTGEFEGATGFFEEIGTLRRFTPKGDLEATIELRIRFATTS